VPRLRTLPCVKMLGEYSREQIVEAFKAIDVVVCPSREESMSIVCTEGLMNKKAVIVTKTTGITAFLNDGENALFVETEDADDLAAKIRYCLENPAERKRLGENGRRVYKEVFSMEVFGENLMDIVEENIG